MDKVQRSDTYNVGERYPWLSLQTVDNYISQERLRLAMPDEDLYAFISRYTLKWIDFRSRGFSVEIFGVVFIKNIIYPGSPKFIKSLDQYIKESEERRDDKEGSGFCSNKSNDSSATSSDNEADEEMSNKSETSSKKISRECARCYEMFDVDARTNDYLNPKICVHHHGRLYDKCKKNGEFLYHYWTCCKRLESSPGCTTAKMHVWSGFQQPQQNMFEIGYVRTLSCMSYKDKFGIYALDCEMCCTKNGFELAKVTLVDLYGNIVYHRFVKTTGEIIDYNSTYSGITEQIYLSQETVTLQQVQYELITFVFAETILIGHNLASDFKALRIYHENVVDTTKMFPHETREFPFCKSLKTLAKIILKRNIQENMHDSVEDARAVVDLVLRKVYHDMIS